MKKITQLILLISLLLTVAGCGLSLGGNVPKDIDLSKTPLFGAAPVVEDKTKDIFNAHFNKSQEDFIGEFKKSSYLKGVTGVADTNPRVETDTEDDSLKEYRYSYGNRVVLRIETRTVKEVEKIRSAELSQSFKDPSPDFIKFEKAFLDVLLQPETPELLEELLEHGKHPMNEAERTGYGQQVIQFDNAYITFKANDTRRITIEVDAVTTKEEYLPFTYFDGEKYHLYKDEKGKLRHVTEEDLFVIASEFYKGLEGEKLPEKLIQDLPEEYTSFIKSQLAKLPKKTAEDPDVLDTDSTKEDSGEKDDVETEDLDRENPLETKDNKSVTEKSDSPEIPVKEKEPTAGPAVD